jgi:endonuclease YncB( thermonuclease family)
MMHCTRMLLLIGLVVLGAAVIGSIALRAPARAEESEGTALPPLPHRDVAMPRVHVFREDDGSAGSPRQLDLRQPPKTTLAPGVAPSPPPRHAPSVQTAALRPMAPLNGRPTVRAATTLEFSGRQVRLFGVRAPASGARCGQELCADGAMALLRRQLAAGTVSCRFPSRAQIGICRDASGLDLAALLVGEGLAETDRRESFEYVRDEDGARAARRGMWQFR